MKVSSVLAKDIIKIRKDASLLDAVKLLFKNQVSSLLVINDDDQLVGYLSEKDIYRALHPDYRDYYSHPEAYLDYEAMEIKAQQIQNFPVWKFMNDRVICISEDDPLMKVGAIMLAKHINRLPVLSKEGKLVGIVSRRELYHKIFDRVFQEQKDGKNVNVDEYVNV